MGESLQEFWGRFDLSSRPFVHPADRDAVCQGPWSDEGNLSFESFLRSDRFGDAEDRKFHLSLLPVPFCGKLDTADIIVLLLNPGFTYMDYYAEEFIPDLKDRLISTLQQRLDGLQYPFIWLDPQFCWHAGFVWWEKKLRGVLGLIAKHKYRGNYLEALADLSSRLASIELVPYHSASFSAHALIRNLSSSKAAQDYVRTLLKAQNCPKTVILTRQEAAWDLGETGANVVIYRGGHTRGASLSPESAGGRAILAAYGIDPAD